MVTQEEVKTAAVIVPIIQEHGVYKVVIAKAGNHYTKKHGHEGHHSPKHMAFGGITEEGETPKEAAVRELEEEMKDADGVPVLPIATTRLQRISNYRVTLFDQSPCDVSCYSVVLTPDESTKLKEHLRHIESDKDYHRKVRDHTISPYTGLPEICAPVIAPLRDVIAGQYPLLHTRQMELFAGLNKQLSAPYVGV